MIRVTLKGSKKPAYYDYMIYPLRYHNYSDMIEFRYYTEGGGFSTTSDAVEKIEKQAKDLTVKELMHLNMEVCNDRVIVNNTWTVPLDHWVDVTYVLSELSESNEKIKNLSAWVRDELWKWRDH